MPDDEAAARGRLCRAVVEYLRAHEHAADTAEGIARVWLAGFDEAPLHIEAVLGRMTEKGLVAAHTLPDGQVLYRKGEAAE